MHPDSRVVKMGQGKSRLPRAFIQGVPEKAREETEFRISTLCKTQRKKDLLPQESQELKGLASM